MLVAGFLLWLALVASAANAQTSTFDPAYASQVQSVANLDGRVLSNLMSETSRGRYYSDGEWHTPSTDPGCWVCLDGAATGAAVLGTRADGAPGLLPVAEETFDNAIATDQLPGGAFQVEGKPNQVATGMELVELGITYLELRERLDPLTRANWIASIERASDYLIESGATAWYINGNVQLRQVEDMWLAWKVTGAARFQSAYESEWSFAVAPSQATWPGFGLQFTGVPSRPDGSDGAGYLAESGGGSPGFDPEYTTAQLDTAASLWILTHDERYLRLMNLLFDQLRPLIDSKDILNATEGTRKHNVLPFFSMAPEILLESGDRPDLAAFVSVQLGVVAREYSNPAIYENLNFYRGLGTWLSVPLLYEQWPEGVEGAHSTQPGSPEGPQPGGVEVPILQPTPGVLARSLEDPVSAGALASAPRSTVGAHQRKGRARATRAGRRCARSHGSACRERSPHRRARRRRAHPR